ncbi:serine/threonine-protein kinase [Serratia fonticola]|uniref:serine/threonine-protein kinase n=1 Tax=Serratia fonticola TaxID=47917 RepID=UPI00301BD668
MIKTGDVIGDRYEIICHAGKGGMQDVFKAKDIKLDLIVALKTPLPGLETKRFSRSARIAALVNHHNIAKTLDYIEENETVYLAEEFVEGETLEDKLKHFGFLDPHIGAAVLHNLAKGIRASHKAGVIHRDLKPSNIMATNGVNLSEIKITDFGIATLTEQYFDDLVRNGGDLTQSTSGTIRGALPFMAPELMFRKAGEPVNFSADIWSLGAMMFRLLTGIYPFGVYLEAAANVKTKNREGWPDFMTKNPQFSSLSNELKDIIERCLDYVPENRPTADELVSICESLCYLSTDRYLGNIERLIQGGVSGFIRGELDSFFSMESVYGPNRPDTGDNQLVCYSTFPGTPKPRAHPVLVWKK